MQKVISSKSGNSLFKYHIGSLLTRPGALRATIACLTLLYFLAATAPSTAAPSITASFSLGNATAHPAKLISVCQYIKN